MKKICFIKFWNGFNYKENIITKTFFSDYHNYIIIDDFMSSDILIIGSFVNRRTMNILGKYRGIKILCLSEPIEHFHKHVYTMYVENFFHAIFGCINNTINTYKYPLYILDYKKFDNINDINILLQNVNKHVKTENLDDKKFACLINTHDAHKIRTRIYNLLCKINNIDCPSRLFNNCSNEELNTIGNVAYIKKYIFNICAENSRTIINGYITEKLMNACLAGSIPIYFGSYDDIDEKIFNKNRIIFYNPYDYSSLQNAYNNVLILNNNKKKLEDFYKQDVFCETAYDTIISMRDNVQKMFDKYIL